MHLQRRDFLRMSSAIASIGVLPDFVSSEASQRATGNGAGLSNLVNLADFEALAQKKLSHMAYEYIAGGAGDEITMRWNREALDAIRLNPRVLVDVQPVDTTLTLLGQKHTFPVLLAPTAFHRLAHPQGEVETARGANTSGVAFIVSS